MDKIKISLADLSEDELIVLAYECIDRIEEASKYIVQQVKNKK